MYNSPIAVLKGIRTEFAKQLADMSGPMFKAFVQTVKGNGAYEDFRFKDTVGKITEWKANRTIEDFKDYLYTIRPKHWDHSISVDRDTLDDSRITLGGDIEKDVRESVQLWNAFADELIYNLLIDNGTAFDGSTFFGNSHNIDGDNAIDNLYSGTGTTLAQVEADYAGAKKQLRGFRDKNNRPYNRNAKYIVLAPSQLEDKFLTLRNSQQVYISGSKTNVYANTFDLILNDWQGASDNDWYIINTNATVLPFAVVDRQRVNWKMVDDPLRKDVLFLSDARMQAGYGTFTSIIKIDN